MKEKDKYQIALKTKFYIWGEEEDLQGVLGIWGELFKNFRIEDNDDSWVGIPVGELMNVLVGSPCYEGILSALDVVQPTKLSFRAQIEKPEALLYAFREAFPNLRIIEEKDFRIDGPGMKTKLEELES